MSEIPKMQSSAVILRGFLHKGISRLQAEEILLKTNKDGSYLVRESETIPGAFTLCLLHHQKVHQYRILPDEDGKIFVQAERGVQQRKFVDLIQLIHEYVHRGDKNGLVCGLGQPIPSEDYDDNTEENKEDSDDDDTPSSNGADKSSSSDGLLNPPQHRNISGVYSSSSLASSHVYHHPSALPVPGAANGTDSLGFLSSHPLVRHMHQRFSQLDLSDFDGVFIDDLRKYIEEKVLLDEHIVQNGGENLNHLRKLLSSAARDLDRQLELYFAKLDAIRHLFGPITTPPLSSPVLLMQSQLQVAGEISLQSFLDRLNQCCKAVSNLERKAGRKLLELSERTEEKEEEDSSSLEESSVPCVPRRKSPGAQPVIPPTAFEAKVLKLGKHSKVKLTVDIQSGKLFCVKPSKDILDESNVFTHDKVEQLIKNTSQNNRLDIKIQNKKKETYVFESVRERENFCQLMQQLKNMHSIAQEVENLSLFVGTWNMGEEHPPWNLGPWLKSQGQGKTRCPTLSLIPHDLYVIGTQESALNEKEWTNKLKSAMMDFFGIEMHTVVVVSLWAIRIVILVKPEFKHKISHVQHSSVKTGIANALGNKGAVGVSLNFNGTSFCFINAHLTSGHERNHRRNANFRDIIKGLNLKPKGPRSLFDITNQFHHMFFIGDLNYRLENLDPQDIIRIITKDKNYPFLLEHDQLRKTQNAKEAFVGFCEEEISFPPTYRIERGTTQHYIWQKFKKTGTRINAPSWCDRVLWKSYPDTYIRNVSYGCVDTILTSDHKPVFATFDVSIIGQFVSSKGASADNSGDVKIVFEEIKVEIKTSGRENFRIEFHSSCLEEPVLGGQNYVFGQNKPGYCLPQWSSADLPQLQPIFDNRDFLEDQHILLAVKTADGMESYGECVLALKSMFSSVPQPFFSTLLHLGEETGHISGLMHVKTKEGSACSLRAKKSRRSYELIYMDTDSLFLRDKEASLSRATGMKLLQNTLMAIRPFHDSETKSNECDHGKNSTPTPRKPRMGQSSLTQGQQVLPVVESSNGRPVPTQRKTITTEGDPQHIYTNQHVQPVALPPIDDVSSGSIKLRSENTSRRHAVRESVISLRDNPLYAEDPMGAMCPDDSVCRDSGQSSEPPTPPPRRYLSDEATQEYAVLRTPSSINEWLLNLSLPQYIQSFFEKGFDSIKSLGHINESTLTEMDIVDPSHHERILKSIRDMKESSL